jgi:hypothetical protein
MRPLRHVLQPPRLRSRLEHRRLCGFLERKQVRIYGKVIVTGIAGICRMRDPAGPAGMLGRVGIAGPAGMLGRVGIAGPAGICGKVNERANQGVRLCL